MAIPRICVLRAPGTNCDVETAFAFDAAGGNTERVHLFRLLENPERLLDFQILCIAGGFSYGDDIGAGVIFSRQLQGPLGDVLGKFLSEDRLLLGICNGFQVLLKAGVLPFGTTSWPVKDEPAATLTWNQNGRYTAHWAPLRVTSTGNVFLRDMDSLELPFAHAEGRFVVRDEDTLARLQADHQVALCYGNGAEESDKDVLSAANPNGSVANIAGLGDASGRVLGLMPHPERFIHHTQHPQWTRHPDGPTDGAGLKIFRNAVSYFE